MNPVNRLLLLREENKQAKAQMLLDAPRFQRIEQRAINGTAPKAVTGFNLFQTPPEVAERMAEVVREELPEGGRILEPSAGLGRLLEPLEDIRADWVLVEEAIEVYKALQAAEKHANKKAVNADFLALTADALGGDFDAVCMNPPFKMGRDIKHIEHALGMIKPGGILVSLCYNGVKQNKKLKPLCDTWEVLPEGSFKKEGTGASVALLTIRKK